MKKELSIMRSMLLLLFVVAQIIGCTRDPEVVEVLVEESVTTNPNEVGEALTLNVFDARSLSSKALENDASTEFQPGDKIGLFIVIGDYLQQFNECYTMNSNGVWTGQGAYWGDDTSDVYYYAYYPYMKSLCFDDYYETTLGVVDEDDDYGEVDGTYGTGTPDGHAPLFNNEIEEVTDAETGLVTSYKVVKRGTKYLVAPIADAASDSEERTAEYFFHDIIGKWQPRRYQAGNNYSLSDLMVCRGYFSQTSINQYPLTLALKHQMSMMHFEFPSKYKFDIGTDGQGSLVAIDQPAEYVESYKFPEGFLGDGEEAVDEYVALWGADGSPDYYTGAGEPTPGDVMTDNSLSDTDVDRGTLSIYVDAVKKLSETVIGAISNIEKFAHDLTEIEGSTYYQPDTTDADGVVTTGKHNEFRYIIRPHDADLVSFGSYSGALVHISYSYMNVDENGDVTQVDGVDEVVANSYNTNFKPTTNGYVHYMMDDGDIPTGDPALIRTAVPDGSAYSTGDEEFYPTCVGAFWRHDQSGERIVKIQPSQTEDLGEWRAFVYQMDANWDSNTDIRLSTDASNVNYDDDAEEHQVTTLSQSISGTCGVDNPIVFKIGLTEDDWDMKSNVTGFYTPARYAVVMLIYANSTKYQLIYLRQGEDPDYLFSKYDTYTNKAGVSVNRAYATKLSPYNLTAQSWKDETPDATTKIFAAEPVSVVLQLQYADSPDATKTKGTFVDYPSQVGGYITPSTYSNHAYYLLNATDNYSSSTIAMPWVQAYYEASPKGVSSADGTRTFDYERPNAGMDTAFDPTYDGAKSQFAHSLFYDPLNNGTNCQSGYYADGFHDRRQVGKQYTTRNMSSTGMLFYNPSSNASVFLPAGGVKSYSSSGWDALNNADNDHLRGYNYVAMLTSLTTYASMLPVYAEHGVYITRSAISGEYPVVYHIAAPTDQTTSLYTEFEDNPSEYMYGRVYYSSSYHNLTGCVRPFVSDEVETPVDDGNSTGE